MTTKSAFHLDFKILDALGYLCGLASFIWAPFALGALIIVLLNVWRGRGAPALTQLVLAGTMALLACALVDGCVPSRTGISHTGKPLTAEEVAGRILEARFSLRCFVAALCVAGIFATWRSLRNSRQVSICGLRVTAVHIVWVGLPVLLMSFYGLSIITWRVLHPSA